MKNRILFILYVFLFLFCSIYVFTNMADNRFSFLLFISIVFIVPLFFTGFHLSFLMILVQIFNFFWFKLVFPELSGSIIFIFAISTILLISLAYNNKIRNYLFRLLYLCFVVIIVIIGAELMVRESPLGEFFDIKKIIYARSIRIDKQSTYLTKKNIDNFFIDSVGRKFPAKKSNDIYRIICIGSSTTEGHGAGMESYPVRLEELLKDSIENVEVINAGIKGAQFYSLYIYLKDILLKLEPDLIIVYFGYNDDSFAVYQYFQRAQEIKIKYPFIDNVEDLEYALNFRFCSPSLLKIYRWLFSSRLFTVLKLNLNNMITNFGFKDVDEQQNKGFKKKNIGMLIDCCLSHSASLVLIPEVIMHDSGEYAGYFKDFEDEARAIYYYCPNRVDLIGYLTDSVHFTKEGYKHLAYQIGYYILEKNIVFRSKTTSGNGE